jgi:basic membrane lipoprotein Med (substrate-binding protein (PBP1-ABC) superfamily)
LLAALVTVAVNLALSSCRERRPQSATPPQGPIQGLRVGLLVSGSVDDGGWNQLAKQGLDRIASELGAQTSYQLAAKPDMVQGFKSYARSGYHLVIGHGGEYGSAVTEIAPQFPDTRFVISSGDVKGPNYTSIKFELAQAAYLAGILAASVSRTGKAGQIGGEKFAPVAQAFRAFEQGGKSYRPGFKVTTDYVGDWQNAGKAKEQALAMIRRGADVLFQNADAAGAGVFQAARENSDVRVIGSNADQAQLAPEVVIASAVLGVPKAFVEVARDVRDRHLKSDFYVENLRGSVDVTLNPRLASRIPAKARQAMEKARQDILAGRLNTLPPPQ